MSGDDVGTGVPAETGLLVAYLARERAFKGIGPRRAAALGAALGTDLKRALLDLDVRVVDLIGEEPALIAAAVMETRQAETFFLEWLDQMGVAVPAHKAIRLARAWGPQGIEAISANPYLLLAVSDWTSVDRIARALGVPEDDTRRDVAALEAALMSDACIGRGSTRLAERDAERAAERLLGRRLAPGMVAPQFKRGEPLKYARSSSWRPTHVACFCLRFRPGTA